MLERIRTTLLAVMVPTLLSFLPTGCAASASTVKKARNSGYDADFTVVYDVALATVRKDYPHLVENATTGVIKTSWHPIRGINAADDPNQTSRPFAQDPLISKQRAAVPKVYFIRFSIYVVGGKPWRVRVDGQAAEWEVGGAQPSPLYGANVPPWLDGRVNNMRVKIHKQLKKYAVPLKETTAVKKAPPKEVDIEVDQTHLGQLPPLALEAVVAALTAAKERKYDALRKVMRDDFTWSLGAEPNADQAVMMWQADSSVLTSLIDVLEAGCALDDSKAKALCPLEYRGQPDYLGYRAVFQQDAEGNWAMSFFVRGD